MTKPNPRALCAAFAMAALLATGACSKHDEGKPSGVPPLPNAPAAPAPAAPAPERSSASPSGASAGGAGPAQAPAAPASERSSASPSGASAGGAGPAQGPDQKITGQIVLSPAMKAHVAPTDTLYVVARRLPDNPNVRGSLVAVKKLTADKFPLDFELSAADMPFQNGAFEGDLELSVRDNKSGDPIVRRKGDVFGKLPKVRVGAHAVKLPLDQLQKEDESLAGGQMGGGGSLPPGHP
jgi:hypothetical protein